MSEKHHFMVFSGTERDILQKKICAGLVIPLGKYRTLPILRCEFAVSPESIRGAHIPG